MRTAPPLSSFFLLMFFSFSVSLSTAETPPELSQLRLDFEVELAEVSKNEPLEVLNEKYRGYLEELKATHQKNGELDALLGVIEEMEGFEGDLAEGLSSFPELRRLQEIYRAHRRVLESVNNERKLKLLQASQKKAKELSIQRTREGRIDEAKLALEEANRIAAMVAAIPKPMVDGNSGEREPMLPSAGATKNEPFENSLGMLFVPVPITGGASDGETILFSVWETRGKDYEAFIKDERDRSWTKAFFQEDSHPAVNVSWEDAVAFCAWLTEIERKKGNISIDQHYRLPTDHEWSCAVGIGRDEDAELSPREKDQRIRDVYPWGKDWPPPRGTGNFLGEEAEKSGSNRRVIQGYDDGFEYTAPVGSFDPNEYGLYDLSGNAIEWCQDLYSPLHNHHALRGGSWEAGFAGAFFSSDRWNAQPGGAVIGFRCVLSP